MYHSPYEEAPGQVSPPVFVVVVVCFNKLTIATVTKRYFLFDFYCIIFPISSGASNSAGSSSCLPLGKVMNHLMLSV